MAIGRWTSYLVSLGLCVVLTLMLFSPQGLAGVSGSGGNGNIVTQNKDCPSDSGGSGTTAQSTCNSCISAAMYQNIASGSEIINAMFTAINTILDKVMKSFFNGIVTATDFQKAIGAGVILYVAFYGIIITFGLGTYRVNEVATRLVKVAFVYALTSPSAWNAFNTWVYVPVIGVMNQLIREFTQVAESGSGWGAISIPYSTTYTSGASGGLDATNFAAMFGSSMTIVFSVQLATGIISVAKTGFFGWLIAILLMWGLVEFLLMLISAIVSYAKAIIGLAFLFGIAPIFFIFLLFDRSRNIFFTWMAQVFAFALQPVMLFAFLSFYIALINQAAPYLMSDEKNNPTNFCWTKWLTVPGQLWDMFMWSPTSSGGIWQGPWQTASGQVQSSPINVPNAVYFLMLCHLGRTFSKFIDTLVSDITQGISPGTIRGGDIAQGFKQGARGAASGLRAKKK